MKRILIVAGTALFAVLGAAAQDEVQQKALADKIQVELQFMAQEVRAEAGVMAQPVQGAPFSATEVNETTQTLADGTKIHNEHQTMVYRDGAGRTRREMGNTVVINDPVAKVRYTVNNEHKSANTVPMNFVKAQGNVGYATVKTDGWVAVTPQPREPATNGFITKDGQEMRVKVFMKDDGGAKREDLGTQTMEGVVAQGTRTTRTIPVGDIGNDRPIQITNERWMSPQLQTVMMTVQNDPRSGETVFKLTGVKLGEPDPGLFQVPAGYTVTERK